jgi:hypothetical protein
VTSLPASFATPRLEVRLPSQRALTSALIALCFLSALAGRFCFLVQPFDYDASIFIYMGKMTCQGGRLCHDLVDNKFPTVGLMTSIIWRFGGTCWPAYIVLQSALSVASAFMLSRVVARTTGPHAMLPTLLFALVGLNFTSLVFGGFQLETLLVFFTTIAAWAGAEAILTQRGFPGFIAGLCAGCGAMLKPTGLGVLLAISLAIALRPTRRMLFLISAIIAGVCLPAAASFVYLFNADLLGDMPGLYRQIATYASQSSLDLVQISKPIIVLTVLGFPMLIRGVVCRRDRIDANPAKTIWALALSWLAIETIGIVMQRRMYAYHFLPMVPPAALLFGMIPRRNRAGALAGALLPIMLLSAIAARHVIQTTHDTDRLPLSDYLLAHTQPGDRVWADAWPRVMLETGLSPGGRYPFTFLFANSDTAGLDYSAVLLADFDRLKPKYIALPTPLAPRLEHQTRSILELNQNPIRRANYLAGWRRIEQYTLEHYVFEAESGRQNIYRRRGE